MSVYYASKPPGSVRTSITSRIGDSHLGPGARGSVLDAANWNCRDYSRETRDFVNTDRSGRLVFGYRGQHATDFAGDIGREDIRWLLDRIEA